MFIGPSYVKLFELLAVLRGKKKKKKENGVERMHTEEKERKRLALDARQRAKRSSNMLPIYYQYS